MNIINIYTIKMKRILYVFIALAALMAAGCNPEDLGGSFSVTPTTLEFDGNEGTQTLTVTAESTWALKQTSGVSWCTPSRTYGKTSMKIEIKVKANAPKERTAEFVFSCSGCPSITVTVKQAAGTAELSAPTIDLAKLQDGFTLATENGTANADESARIYFKASADSPLYGYTGDAYAHIGVVDDYNEWHCVPGDWPNSEKPEEWPLKSNFEENKYKKEADNIWSLALAPTIREWFGSGEIPVNKIGVIIRSEDGTLKGLAEDYFFNGIVDNKYTSVPFNPHPVEKGDVPAGADYGINYNADGSVTFVLYDLGTDKKFHKYCYIVGDWNNWERVKEGAMKRDYNKGCWWITLKDFDPNKEYRFQYRLGNESGADTFLSDPYTEIVYDQWNDKYLSWVPEFPEGARQLVSAFQINRPQYNWKHKDFKVEDKNDLVIYEMHFRDFSTTQNIEGAMAQLDYIQNLGVTAVELMPIQEFDGNLSWGYDPNHWFALDKQYGSREQYKQFIDECHARGIAVIVDVVYNHATGNHTWAKMWWDSASNCTSDNNPWFNKVAKHEFNVFHDMNHENPMVKEMVKGSLEYLLTEYDVDGFRFDLTKGFTQNNTLGNLEAWGNYDQSRVNILKDYADHVWSVNKDAVVIFEHLADWDEEKVLAEHGIKLWRNMNGSYRSAVCGGNGDFSGSYERTGGLYGGWVSYMESHDEERVCYGAGADASTVTWGICGTLTSWGGSPDIKLAADGAFFSAKNVTFKADDMFKIRGNSSWNDSFNYGASTKGYKLPLNQEYKLTLGSASQDMAVPAAGTYDIYFSLAAEKVWLMTSGQRPANPSTGSGSGSSGSNDAFSVAMRRAGASAAFFLTVPGPKMIWQFGEIGYDISIEENGRTGEKPVKTAEYMAVPQRKALYDTYAKLLKFRKENPRFFDSDASFSMNAGGGVTTKTITCSAADKTFHVVGNFAKNQISYSVPSGSWTDYINGGTVSGTITLKEGEFRLLTK